MTSLHPARHNSARKAGKTAALLVLIALVTVATAWGFQLIGGYLPCALCYQQRWAWYAIIPLGFVLAVIAEWRPAASTLVRVGLFLAGLILLAGAGLAAYHAGIEWGFWPGPKSCAGSDGLSGGLPDLDNIVLVRCGEVQWQFAGLSFAGWNGVISLAASVIAFSGAFSSARGKSA